MQLSLELNSLVERGFELPNKWIISQASHSETGRQRQESQDKLSINSTGFDLDAGTSFAKTTAK